MWSSLVSKRIFSGSSTGFRRFYSSSRGATDNLGTNQNSKINTRNSDSNDEELIKRIKIPPIKRTNETLDKMRSRLVYQSRKRGILETDLLLSGFASKYLKKMNESELKEYDSLLNELDWDIYYWATRNFKISPLPDKWKDSKILEKLQKFTENKEKEMLRMPDLDKY